MNEEQLKALSALTGNTTGSTKESKTVDFKVSVENKAGQVRSVGILKLWKRFNEKQMGQITKKLSAKGVFIEALTGETAESDDEF